MTATPVPGAAGGGEQAPAQISDEQVIKWAAEAAGDGPATASTMHTAHRLFDQAKHALARRCPGGSRHLLESVELWPNLGTCGTLAGILLTVDLPPGTSTPEPDGVRLCTLQIDLEDLVDPDRQYPTAEELYTDLLTNALSYARDEIDKHRRALHHDDLTEALAEARAALVGDSGDAEHDALHGLAERAESILAGGGPDAVTVRTKQPGTPR